MKDIIEILPSLEGVTRIRDCWGDVPPFRWSDLLHVKQSGSYTEQRIMVTAIFWTHGPEDINECNPSRIVFEFCGIDYWESGSDIGRANGIPIGKLLSSPPPGSMAVQVHWEFFVACRSVRVVSCVREPFGRSS